MIISFVTIVSCLYGNNSTKETEGVTSRNNYEYKEGKFIVVLL